METGRKCYDINLQYQECETNPSDLRMVLLGKNAVEKSFVGNMILGREAFKEKSRASEVQTGTVDDRNISVIDTPGFFNSELTDEDLQDEMMKSLSLSHPGPHVFLLIVRPDAFSECHVDMIVQKMQENFGAQVLKFTLVLFIRENMKNREWMVLTLSKKYQDLIGHFRGRHHVINTESETTDQLSALLEKIDQVIRQNNNKHFNNNVNPKSPMLKSPTLMSPTLKSPTLMSPTLKSPTLMSPTLKSSTLMSPTLKSPTLMSPTLKSPTLMPPTLKSPTLMPPTLMSPTLMSPTLMSPTLKSPTLMSPTLKSPTLMPPTLMSPTLMSPTLMSPTLMSPTLKSPTLKSPTLMSPTLKSSTLMSPMLKNDEVRLRKWKEMECEVESQRKTFTQMGGKKETVNTDDAQKRRESWKSSETEADLRIVMVGKSGNGKSATGNTILGSSKFKEEISSKSVTKECQENHEEVEGKMISVTDTPGLFDTSRANEDLKGEIEKCIEKSVPGPHVFLLVLRVDARFTDEEQNTVKWIQENFSDDAMNHAMAVFTRGDQLDKPIDEFLEDDKKLKNVVDTCKGGYHVLNNKVKNRRQVTELLKKIDTLVEKNGGHHYTNSMYQEAQKKIKEKQQREREEDEKKRKEEEKTIRKEERDMIKDKVKKVALGVGAGIGVAGAVVGTVALAATPAVIIPAILIAGGAAVSGGAGGTLMVNKVKNTFMQKKKTDNTTKTTAATTETTTTTTTDS